MINDEGEFSHIFSFRRTFYGIPERDVLISDSLLLNFEHENHRIFLTTEIKRCDNCHKIGHLIAKCKQKSNNENTQLNTQLTNNNTTAIQNVLTSNSSNTLPTNSTLIELNDTIDKEMMVICDTNNDTFTKNTIIEQTQLKVTQENALKLHGSHKRDNENKNHGGPSKTTKVQNADGVYAELQKVFESVVDSHISFEFFKNLFSKLSKKEIDNDEIRLEYDAHIKEITKIVETLREVTASVTKARLTRTLMRIQTIFKYQCPKLKIENKNSTSNELTNNSVESMQLSSAN